MSRTFLPCLVGPLATLLLLAAAGCGHHDAVPTAVVARPSPPVAGAAPMPPTDPGGQAARYQALMKQHPEITPNARR